MGGAGLGWGTDPVCVFVFSVCDPVLGDHGSMVSLLHVHLCYCVNCWR